MTGYWNLDKHTFYFPTYLIIFHSEERSTLMNSDELSRGTNNHYTRKPMPSKYNDKSHNSYGPGQNYSYGNQSYNGNSHYNGGNSYNNGNSFNNHNNQQNQRRRTDRFKRDNYNNNDRLIKQNDIIIRLLKEIRDRLPAPEIIEPEYFEEEQENQNQDQSIDSTECNSEDQEIHEEEIEVMEPANEDYGSEQDEDYQEEDR